MSLALAVVVFFGLTLVLVILPFVPGLKEWRSKTDAEPLVVVHESEVNIRHFAEGFLSFIESYLKEDLAACRRKGGIRDGLLEDGTRFIITSNGRMPVLTKSEQRNHSTDKMILSCGDLRLPEETMFLLEIYAAGSLHGGEKSIYRAILAQEDIHLGGESMSLRWLHAGGSLRAESGCVLYGRVSADEAIRLDGSCRFERLNAPRIVFDHVPESVEAGRTAREKEGARRSRVLKPEEVPHLAEVAAGRWLIERKLEIPPGVRAEANLVVAGWTRVGREAHIAGSLKSHKDLRLDNGVEVEGSVVSGSNLYIGPDCRIHGPVIAEKNIYISGGCVVGTVQRPTTVSARGIYVAHGTVTHGTVWAHTNGELSSMSESKRSG